MTRDHVAEFIKAEADPDMSVASPAAILDAFTRHCRSASEMAHRLDVDGFSPRSGFGQMAVHTRNAIAFERCQQSDCVATVPVDGDGHIGECESERLDGDKRRSVRFAKFKRVLHRLLLLVRGMTAPEAARRKGKAR